METAEQLVTLVFRFYGLPEDIVSDRGPQFTSRVWAAFFTMLSVNVSLTSGYHPQSNGQIERFNQELTSFRTSQNQNDWSHYIMWVARCLPQPLLGLQTAIVSRLPLPLLVYYSETLLLCSLVSELCLSTTSLKKSLQMDPKPCDVPLHYHSTSKVVFLFKKLILFFLNKETLFKNLSIDM